MQDKAVLEAISVAFPLGVFEADAAGQVVQASVRWQVLMRTDAAGPESRHWSQAVHPQDRERVLRAWRASVYAREPFDTEFRVLGAQEQDPPTFVRMQARPALRGEPPQPGFVGVAGDTTHRKQVEQQLRAANRFLERAERLSGVGGWEADLVARTVKWTDQNCRIYDLEPGHQAGFDEHLKYFGEDAKEAMLRALRRALRSGESWDLDLPMVTARGRAIWVRSVGVAEFEGARAVRLVGALQDITEQRAAQDALRESEERQKRAMDASRLALWDLDLETGLGYLSENWSTLLGGPSQVTVTDFQGLMARVPADDQERVRLALTAALKGETERYDIEHQMVRDDGTLIWIQSQGRVSRRDADGRAVRATGTNQDINVRKLAELQLARGAAITRATLDSTADGLLVVDGARDIQLFNQRLLEMLKLPGDMIGATRETWGDLVVSQVKDPESYTRRVLALYDAPETESFDLVEFKDGRVFERYGRALALEGAATGRVWSFRDVTERHRADAEIKRAMEAAEDANRAKSEFLDTMSHEMRTPLNGVLGMTNMLLAETLTPQQRRLVELAHSSAQSLLVLINDLLDLGKIESGRMEFEHVEFSLVELAREFRDLYGMRAKDKGLDFEVRLDPAVPATVVGDPGRLRQVLNNLLSNALKFTESGAVGLDIHSASTVGDRLMLGFTVYDTGIGIPEDVQQGLFQRFFQADSSTTREYGGTGLGLAIVKQLCEQMGGSVTLQSQPGRGASFRCRLPFVRAAARSRMVAPAAGPRARRQLRSERILVAEDNATNQIVVRGMLEIAGYRNITLVADGQQALDAIARERFDAVLLDCRMPVMDGYEAASQLRADGWRLPIIALTANVSDEQRQKCLAAGMDDFLSKPMETEQLAQMLDRWLTAARLRVFDRQKALERLDGDDALFGEVLGSFVALAPNTLAQVRTALQAGEHGAVHRHLHSLAGSAAMVNADTLCRLAGDLEREALEGRHAEVSRGLGALQSALDDFLLVQAETMKDTLS
ncbi:MAG: two component system sensor kinase, hybrid [Ramlibacter sp.]|nr:two component system sensor kinase, hybrid [Ramlibacter sp.]